MSKVVQINLLVSSRESNTTFDLQETVASEPSVPGGTVTSYPHIITPTFAKADPPDSVEFYLKANGKITFLKADTAAPFNWTADDWSTLRELYNDIYNRYPADPFTCKIAVKCISSEHVEWAQNSYTFGSS